MLSYTYVSFGLDIVKLKQNQITLQRRARCITRRYLLVSLQAQLDDETSETRRGRIVVNGGAVKGGLKTPFPRRRAPNV